jgi:hypothetical protein
MSELVVVGALALALIFVVHLCRLGTYYIEFDGKEYWVWQRQFMGYNKTRGFFSSEGKAQARVKELRANPPRVIKPAE